MGVGGSQRFRTRAAFAAIPALAAMRAPWLMTVTNRSCWDC